MTASPRRLTLGGDLAPAQARPILKPRRPELERLLLGLPIERDHLGGARCFGDWLWRERNSFDVERRLKIGSGLFGSRITKEQAGRALSLTLAEECSA